MDDWEGEFALGKIFAKALVRSIFGRREVEIVIPNLEKGANEIDERNIISTPWLSPAVKLV